MKVLHVSRVLVEVVGVLQLGEGVHSALLLLVGDVATQELVLVCDLRQQFLVETDLLDEAHDRLLLLILKGKPAHLHHLLLLLGLDVALQVIFVHQLINNGMVDHSVIERVVVGFDRAQPVGQHEVTVHEVFVDGVVETARKTHPLH